MLFRSLEALAIGRAGIALGGGRSHVGDAVDHAVGLLVRVKVGEHVEVGQPLVEIHHRDGRGLDEAVALTGGALDLAVEPVTAGTKILGEVR